jgi:hypothetical protein
MVSAATSRRDAAPTPHLRAVPLAFVPVCRPRRPPPEVGRNPRPCSSRGCSRPATRRSPRPRTARAVTAGRALLQSGGPSASSRPRALYHDRGITPSSPSVGPFPYLSARPSSSRRPTLLPPFPRAAVAAAGKPSPCIASGPLRA